MEGKGGCVLKKPELHDFSLSEFCHTTLLQVMSVDEHVNKDNFDALGLENNKQIEKLIPVYKGTRMVKTGKEKVEEKGKILTSNFW